MIKDLLILSYLLKRDDYKMSIVVLDHTSWGEKGEKWAIRCTSMCLNKKGEWEFEPSPSNRYDEFFERCRWNSAEEALEFWNHHPDSK